VSKRKPEHIALSTLDLKTGMPGLTPDYGGVLAEAVSVCLDHQKHSSPTPIRVSGSIRKGATIEWLETTTQSRRCHNDEQVATEFAAYGVAILICSQVMDLHVIERSRKGTGFDYWIGPAGSDDPPFHLMHKLEVSGIRNGNPSQISARVQLKKIQASRRSAELPAIVIVVEFGRPIAKVYKL
jgi:hypothetical protein